MRTRGAVAVIWLCFVARAAFYCAMLPLWEGYDEWSHFAVARIMAVKGALVVPMGSPLPLDVAASLDLAPVPWDMREDPPPAEVEDAYWKQAPEERARRAAAFRAIPEGWRRLDSAGIRTAYEAQHPPLYYWLAALALKVFGGARLGTQVMLLRWMACLMASASIPLVFLTGRAVFRDDGMALGCAAVVAVMPEFALDVARVGNDCLAVPLFTLLIWASILTIREGLSFRNAWLTGTALGLGLLSKAYFLTALPVVAAVCVYAWRRAAATRPSGADGKARGAALLGAVLPPVVIAGWWYARNVAVSGTISGLRDAAAVRGVSFSDFLHRAAHINWLKVSDAILLSHLYFGGWSALTARAWIYHVFYAVAAAAAAGLIWRVRGPAAACLAGFYVCFWAGQYYHATLLSLSTGIAVSPGWYAYAVVAAEVALAMAGLRGILPQRAGRWVAPAGAMMFGLLDLYTVHTLAIPYYSGIIAHKANGGIAGLHGGDLAKFSGAFERLAEFKGPLVTGDAIAALWAGYLAATMVVMVGATLCGAGRLAGGETEGGEAGVFYPAGGPARIQSAQECDRPLRPTGGGA